MKDLNKVCWRYAKENGIEKFPRKLPTRKQFKVIVDRFRKTGSVKPETPPREKPVTGSEENIEKVRNLVKRDVGMSLQKISDEVNHPKSTVWTILRSPSPSRSSRRW